MTSAWLLPEHIADVLPSEARRIEVLRRRLVDHAGCYGFELVIPPLLEHLESLLSGTGESLDLETFKLADPLSGRSLGLRADTTPQVARIDAHLLNRPGVARLAYCGPVVHTTPQGPWSTREPLQFGAEIYGHAGLESDLEVMDLALDVLTVAQAGEAVLDLSDVRIAAALLQAADPGGRVHGALRRDVMHALTHQDAAGLEGLLRAALGDEAQSEWRTALVGLTRMQGDLSLIEEARAAWPSLPAVQRALDDLQWLGTRVQQSHPGVQVSIDLSDLSGHGYYSGSRFSVFVAGAMESLIRGGRYDEVGSVFGRRRPAVGFSLDLKALARVTTAPPPRRAVRAPWAEAPALRQAVRELRAQGHTVVCSLPGHETDAQEFDCDRELVEHDGAWIIRSVPAAAH